MDALLKGHPYVKSGIDIACWDILGQAAGLPVASLLGGRYGEDFVLYRAISQESPEEMAAKVAGYRAEGYRRFQLKVGGDPDVDVERIRAVRGVLAPGEVLIADANTGWLPHQAARVVRAVRDVDVYIEQPCATYEECLSIRRRTDHPFVLDETIDGLGILLRAAGDLAMDVVNIKIGKLGGLTRARQARDLLRLARDRHDDRGLLGRRRRDGRDRPSRPLHADGAPLHLDRLQQLRHGLDGHGRPAAPERPHGGLDGAGPRHHAAAGIPPLARGRRVVVTTESGGRAR